MFIRLSFDLQTFSVFLFLFAFLCGEPFLLHSHAATINAASCSATDITAAVNAANAGDTVSVPSGNCDWNGGVTISKQILLQGAGIGNTILNSTFVSPGVMLTVNGAGNLRITGFTFRANGIAEAIYVHGYGQHSPPTTKGLRFDHLRIEKSVSRSIEIEGDIYGLIDHCQFYNGAISDIVIFRYDTSDVLAWTEPISLGTENAWYVEDCTFTVDSNYVLYSGSPWNHAISTNHGARYVFRYNAINLALPLPTVPDPIDAHGNLDYGRGTVSYEIYNNTINCSSSNVYRLMDIRGGTGVIYNNSWSCGSQIGFREAKNTCSYPCQDQVGRGTNQGLFPVYVWGNSNNLVNNQSSALIVVNRDYYFGIPLAGYTAYTYPHPLASNGQPTAPRNLRISTGP